MLGSRKRKLIVCNNAMAMSNQQSLICSSDGSWAEAHSEFLSGKVQGGGQECFLYFLRRNDREGGEKVRESWERRRGVAVA